MLKITFQLYGHFQIIKPYLISFNEVGKIDDAEFDPKEGKINAITIVLKKNFISSNKIEIDFEDVKSIGDYVLLDKEINKEAAIEEAEKAKDAKEEVEEVEAEIVEDEAEAEEEAEVKID